MCIELFFTHLYRHEIMLLLQILSFESDFVAWFLIQIHNMDTLSLASLQILRTADNILGNLHSDSN